MELARIRDCELPEYIPYGMINNVYEGNHKKVESSYGRIYPHRGNYSIFNSSLRYWSRGEYYYVSPYKNVSFFSHCLIENEDNFLFCLFIPTKLVSELRKKEEEGDDNYKYEIGQLYVDLERLKNHLTWYSHLNKKFKLHQSPNANLKINDIFKYVNIEKIITGSYSMKNLMILTYFKKYVQERL